MMVFLFLVNRSFLQSLMLDAALVLSYVRIRNLSNWACVSEEMPVHVVDISLNAAVASGKTFHTSQADFLPFPQNDDTVSQPVNA